jgi:hypothetical protein
VELTKELSSRIEEINKLKCDNDNNKLSLSEVEKEKVCKDMYLFRII